MKHYIIIFLFTIVFTSSLAQKTASGYYIAKTNDTIKTEIKIHKGVFGQITNDFTKSVQVTDSSNKTLEFTPDDIKEYGFTNEGINYLFISKPTKNGSNKFLTPVFIGSKSSLYQYGIFTQGSGGAFSSSQVFYTFEKADGTFLFLKNMMNKKLKSELKEFYKDNIEVQQLIDTKFNYWLELNDDLILTLYTYNKN